MAEGCTNPANADGGDVAVPFLYDIVGLGSSFEAVVDVKLIGVEEKFLEK